MNINLDRTTSGLIISMDHEAEDVFRDMFEKQWHNVNRQRDALGPLLQKWSAVEKDRVRPASSNKVAADWIEGVLRKHKNTPMSYKELAREAIEAGYRRSARSKASKAPITSDEYSDGVASSFSGPLSHDKRFERAGGGKWRLRHYHEI